MGACIVCLVTIDNLEKATEIARLLVERELVACVNLVPQIRSIYRWKGKVCDDTEILMIMKTREDLFERLMGEVRGLHPYELPEVISWRIAKGSTDYLQWIHDCTTSSD
jgi:periplasmic divalent cation tolerance protein